MQLIQLYQTDTFFTQSKNHKKLTETWKLSEHLPFLSASLTCNFPNIVSSAILISFISPLTLQFWQSSLRFIILCHLPQWLRTFSSFFYLQFSSHTCHIFLILSGNISFVASYCLQNKYSKNLDQHPSCSTVSRLLFP